MERGWVGVKELFHGLKNPKNQRNFIAGVAVIYMDCIWTEFFQDLVLTRDGFESYLDVVLSGASFI